MSDVTESLPRSVPNEVYSSSYGGSEAEQWETLLNGGITPTVVRNQQIHVSKVDTRKRSNSNIFDSFHTSFVKSFGSKETNGHISARRFDERRLQNRVVFKHGECNVVQANVAKRRRRYLQDIFTTLVDAQWRWTLLVFSMNFLLSWLSFGVIWWLIAFTHGDLIPEHVNNNQTWTPCVTNVYGFTSCFLFSVETQHTIGFGGRTITEECPEAIFVMCIQSLCGVMIQAFMVGVVFAKLSRPKKRTQTLLFSRNAVICHRDEVPCLMFRVGDMRKSHIIEAHVRSQLIKHRITMEGENLSFHQTELKVGCDGEEDKILFIWPTTIVHKIDSTSPLYCMSAVDLLREKFEIVVILEGVIESTGMTTQARSSYLPSEILWGHRFQPLVYFKKETGEHQVDYASFNNTIEVITPLCSAKQLNQHRKMYYRHPNGLVAPSSSISLYSLDSYFGRGHSEINMITNPIPSTVNSQEDPTALQDDDKKVTFQ